MSTIQKRTVFYEKKEGQPFRFHDFAQVVTPLGVMVEPFLPNNKLTFGNITDFDPADEMARIDVMQGIDMDREKLVLSDDEVIHGGHCMPRTGR